MEMTPWAYEEPLIDPRTSAYAKVHGLDEQVLDWHLEAIHGWESHDLGFEEAIEQAAECLANGGCTTEKEQTDVGTRDQTLRAG
jgi:hypothetical protein